jgi:amino acid transporter
MNIQGILAFAFLGIVAINAIHCRKDERFLYHPLAGWWRLAFAVWMIAVVVLSVLSLGGFIASPVFVVVALGFAITHEVYSIVRRQLQRAQGAALK